MFWLCHHPCLVWSSVGRRHVPCWLEKRSHSTLLHEVRRSCPLKLFISFAFFCIRRSFQFVKSIYFFGLPQEFHFHLGLSFSSLRSKAIFFWYVLLLSLKCGRFGLKYEVLCFGYGCLESFLHYLVLWLPVSRVFHWCHKPKDARAPILIIEV